LALGAALTDLRRLASLQGHSDDTNCIALHDGLLLSGSDDYTLKVWSTALSPAGEGPCIATLAGHEARVWSVVATDEHIYSCSADKSIVVWSLPDARRGVSTVVARLTAHTDVVYAVRLAFGALFSSSADKTIKRYDLATHRATLSWEAHAHSITCLAAAEQLNLLCSGAEDGRISLWSVDDHQAVAAGSLSVRLSGPRASSNTAVYALAVSPTSGDVLFSGGADYRVHMFDLRERTLLHTLTGHASTVRALCFTPTGDKLCSSGGDFNLLLWRVAERHADAAAAASAGDVAEDEGRDEGGGGGAVATAPDYL
jgi:WD40 repeat protein